MLGSTAIYSCLLSRDNTVFSMTEHSQPLKVHPYCRAMPPFPLARVCGYQGFLLALLSLWVHLESSKMLNALSSYSLIFTYIILLAVAANMWNTSSGTLSSCVPCIEGSNENEAHTAFGDEHYSTCQAPARQCTQLLISQHGP